MGPLRAYSWLTLLLAVQAACVGSESVPCGDGYCRATEVCVSEGAAAPVCLARADSCAAYPEGTPCVGGVCQGDTCTAPAQVCGDGTLQDDEQCDDGAANSQAPNAACRTDCTPRRCGDDVQDDGEQCDDGAANSLRAPNACRDSCALPSCGDGVIDDGEQRGCLRAPTTLIDATPFTQVLAADLDGDGLVDLLTIDSVGGVARVRFALAAGGYDVIDLPADGPVLSLAAGDIDGDGDLDVALVVAIGPIHQLELVKVAGHLLMTGASFALPSVPRRPLLARLDGDALADLALVFGNGTVRVFRASGGGAFATPVDYPVPAGALAIASTDTTADGDVELLLLYQDGTQVLDGAGGASFTLPAYPGLTGGPDTYAAMLVADVTADGQTDVVLAAADGKIVVVRNRVGGVNWAASTPTAPLPSPVTGLASADLDGDDLLDLITVSADGTVRLLWGEEDGHLFVGPAVAAGALPPTFAVADVDHDGFADALVAPAAGGLEMLRGGDGPLGRPRELIGDPITAFLLGHVDGDEHIDLVLARKDQGLMLMRGAPGAQFLAPVSLTSPVDLEELVGGDFDGDGDLDLAGMGTATGTMFSYQGNGLGGFFALVPFDASGASQLTALDVDGDGKDDLVGARGTQIAYWPGSIAGISPDPVVVAEETDKPLEVALADLDGDGLPDVVVRDALGVYYHAGVAGGFGSAAVPLASGEFSGFALGDLDADGHVDLMISNQLVERVDVSYGLGGGAFVSGPSISGVPGVRLPLCARLDADARCDLLFVRSDDELDVVMAEPARKLASLQAFARFLSHNELQAADVDGDGHSDVFAREKGLHLRLGFRP